MPRTALALGCGEMGSIAIKDMAASGVFDTLDVADINLAAAQKVAKECGGRTRVVPHAVDVTDRGALVKLMKGHDVCVSAVGPFYRFALPVCEAAIEAKANFVDICDDYDVAMKVLDLDAKAKKAGITLITGMGGSPGITNLLAKYGASKLDRVDDIHIHCVQSAADPNGGPAVAYHVFHSMTGTVPTWHGGKIQEVKAFVSGKEVAEFPKPVGALEVFHIGHPEPLTLPKYVPGVKHVCMKLNLNPPMVKDMVVQLGNFGLGSSEPMEIRGTKIAPVDFVVAFLSKMGNDPMLAAFPKESAIRVTVKGEKEGRPTTMAYSGVGRMNEGTGTPMSIAAQMVATGKIAVKGAVPPEGAVEPGHIEFLIREMVKRRFTARETVITEGTLGG
ncbi:MAG: saccharopine dehydrogenase NADP-binding domain-containing protein [Halobacteria archaeon]